MPRRVSISTTGEPVATWSYPRSRATNVKVEFGFLNPSEAVLKRAGMTLSSID